MNRARVACRRVTPPCSPLLRNIGSSFFISLSIAEIVRASGANYSRMTEMITPYNRALTAPGVTGGMGFRYGARPCKVCKRNRAPGGDDRVPECVCDVHRDIGACRVFRVDGQTPPCVM
jgi:hypothetical protein